MRSELFWQIIGGMRLAERASLVACGLSLPLTFALGIPPQEFIPWWLLAAAVLTISCPLRFWLVRRPPPD